MSFKVGDKVKLIAENDKNSPYYGNVVSLGERGIMVKVCYTSWKNKRKKDTEFSTWNRIDRLKLVTPLSEIL